MCPKPPRPPKGPILDAADQKLVQDIAEFTARRRAWVQQIKAVKKARASKSSWSSSLSAMVVTILFCDYHLSRSSDPLVQVEHLEIRGALS
ncbi:hypothetical protein K2173_011146 [Erythroxylum novogranatense]|uniref:Uncharacterized protein n=1 Tax=Erythroxylum novogranatense TaxID=1862640 RepID=A0AAV8U9K1_9ROSI|nr:hypothetical protein K2173_011146 [Erythroxylum novogranatense]